MEGDRMRGAERATPPSRGAGGAGGGRLVGEANEFGGADNHDVEGLLGLPVEVWVGSVLVHLMPIDVVSLSATCRPWRHLALTYNFASLFPSWTQDSTLRLTVSRDLVWRSLIFNHQNEFNHKASTQQPDLFYQWRQSQLFRTFSLKNKGTKVPDSHWRKSSVQFHQHARCITVYEHDTSKRPDTIAVGSGNSKSREAITLWTRRYTDLVEGLDRCETVEESCDASQHSEKVRPKIWMKTAVFAGHNTAVTCLRWARDKRMLVSGAEDCTVRLWKLSEESGISTQSISSMHGHSRPVTCVDIDGHRVVSGAQHRAIYVWDLEKEMAATQYTGSGGIVGGVKFIAHMESVMISHGWDPEPRGDRAFIDFWDLRKGGVVHTLRFPYVKDTKLAEHEVYIDTGLHVQVVNIADPNRSFRLRWGKYNSLDTRLLAGVMPSWSEEGVDLVVCRTGASSLGILQSRTAEAQVKGPVRRGGDPLAEISIPISAEWKTTIVCADGTLVLMGKNFVTFLELTRRLSTQILI